MGQANKTLLDYKVEVELNTLTNTAIVAAYITLPADFIFPSDSIYFQLPAQAFASRYSHFGRKANTIQLMDFYFRKDKEYAEISEIRVDYMGNNQTIDYVDYTEEFLRFGVNPNEYKGKSKQLKVAYTIKLPKMIYGTGVEGSVYQLNAVCPIVADQKDGRWSIVYYGTNDETNPHRANYEVLLTTDREVYPITLQGSIDNEPTKKMVYTEVSKNSPPPIIITLNKPNNLSWRIDRDMKAPMQITNLSKSITNADYFQKRLPKYANVYENRLGQPVRNLAFSVSNDVPFITKNNANYIPNFRIVDLWFKDDNAFIKKADWIEESLKDYYHKSVQLDAKNNAANHPDDLKFKTRLPIRNEFFIPSLVRMDSLDNQFGFGKNLVTYTTLLFENIAGYVGAKAFDKVIKDYLASDETFDWEVFGTRINEASGKDVAALINNALYTNKFTDYQLLDLKVDNQVVTLKVRNTKSEALPFGIFMYYGTEKDTVIWRKGFVGEQTIILTPNVDKELMWVELDYNNYLPEYNRYNNRIWTNRANLRLVNPSSNNYYHQKNIRWIPLVAYNDNDNGMFGVAFTGSRKEETPFKFFVMPLYSSVGKKIVGEAWLSYRQYFDQSSKLRHIIYDVGMKSFSKFRNKRFDYTERYIKIDPSITINLRHDNPAVTSYIALKTNYIIEENARFTNNGVFDGKSNQKYLIHQLLFNTQSCGAITTTRFRSALEYQQYRPLENSVKYLKLTSSYDFNQKYSAKHGYSLRFFAGAFLLNDNRRSNNFQDLFTRGSLAMAYQGFNDYTYDGYYFSRENQNGALNNQVNQNAGGGFKTPFGSSVTYGMSNNLVFSTNLAVDIPINLPYGFNISAFLDLGGFSQLDQDDKFKINGMYNGGFAIDFKDKIAIYIPLLFDKNTKQNYFSIHDKFINRISFSFNLNSLKTWNSRS